MIKKFIKYNESIKLIEKRHLNFNDIYEECDHKLNKFVFYANKHLKNKILSFKNKENKVYDKIKIIDVILEVYTDEKFLENYEIIISIYIIDENKQKHGINWKEDIIIWGEKNPNDPYNEENWD